MTDRGRAPTGLIVAVLASSGFIAALMQTLLVTVLPEVPGLLGVSAEDASWLLTATLMASAVATPSLSRLADMHGKRRMILVSVSTMAVGSVIGAVGQSLALLILARALQGVGMALIPIGISIMRDEIPREKLGSAVALMSATLGIGMALGLPLSGLIYTHMGWHALFWVSAATAILMLVAVLIVVPESPVLSAGKFDLVGALLMSAALTTLLLGITKGGRWGWGSSITLLTLSAAVLLAIAWISWELRVGQPIVDLRTSMRRTVLLTNVVALFVGFAAYCNMVTTTQIMQMPLTTGYGLGLTIVQAGALMVPGAVMIVAMAPLTAAVTRTFGAKITLSVGAWLLTGGYILRVIYIDEVWQIVMGFTITVCGMAISLGAFPVLIMRAVPVTETAAANGLNSVVRSIGSATASAAVAAILTSTTMNVAAATFPTQEAFRRVFLIASLAGACGGVITLGLPRHRRGSTDDTEARAEGQEHERVVHGRVVEPDGAPVVHGRVTLRWEDSEPVDWGRTDEAGSFTVAVPHDGRYIILVEAHGWVPTSTVVDIDLGHQPFTVVLLVDARVVA